MSRSDDRKILKEWSKNNKEDIEFKGIKYGNIFIITSAIFASIAATSYYFSEDFDKDNSSIEQILQIDDSTVNIEEEYIPV